MILDLRRIIALKNEHNEYWPFDMPEGHSSEQRFLTAAHNEGFRPFRFGVSDLGDTSKGGRSAYILVRGRTRWETWLGTSEEKQASIFVDDFAFASEAALQWLCGRDMQTVLSMVDGHVIQPAAMLAAGQHQET